MEAVLSLICTKCNRLLMKQAVSCFSGNSATINIDELERFAGKCCKHPNRTARVEIQATTVEATVVDPVEEDQGQ